MVKRPGAIQVEPGSELDHLLERAANTEILLEKEGVRFRIIRVDAAIPDAAPRLGGQPQAPGSVLEIIGLGESAEGGNIARHKDTYVADAADHRGV
jgi:hypothetical protein